MRLSWRFTETNSLMPGSPHPCAKEYLKTLASPPGSPKHGEGSGTPSHVSNVQGIEKGGI